MTKAEDETRRRAKGRTADACMMIVCVCSVGMEREQRWSKDIRTENNRSRN